jgi:hypothetical protein
MAVQAHKSISRRRYQSGIGATDDMVSKTMGKACHPYCDQAARSHQSEAAMRAQIELSRSHIMRAV